VKITRFLGFCTEIARGSGLSRNESIDNGIWSDPDFFALSGPSKLVYIWSFTNPRCGMAGIYRVAAEPTAALECGFAVKQIAAAFRELATTRFVFVEQGVLWVRSRVRYLHSRSPAIATSIKRDLEKIPLDSRLRRLFLDAYADQNWLREVLAPVARERVPTQLKLAESKLSVVGENTNETGELREGLQDLSRGDDYRPQTVSLNDGVKAHSESQRQTSERRARRERVFARWLEGAGKTSRTKLDSTRARLIDRALDDYPIEDVLDAVVGWRRSEFHVEHGHNGLKLLLRGSEEIERFRDMERNPPAPTEENRRAAWAAMPLPSQMRRGEVHDAG
jgi:hypothetical protein